MFISLDDFKKRIEISLVPHFFNEKEIKENCIEAINSNVGVICVNPDYVKFVKRLIGDRAINLSANIGFPWGTHCTEFKVLETKKAINDGANQIDLVINVGSLRSKKYIEVFDDIKAIVGVANSCFVKVIIETWVLDEEEKFRACKIAEEAGANCVKTTTGVKTQYISKFTNKKNLKGAEIEDIVLFRKILKPSTKIKASGGIYSINDALEFIKAGANQLGVSRGVELIREFEKKYKNGFKL